MVIQVNNEDSQGPRNEVFLGEAEKKFPLLLPKIIKISKLLKFGKAADSTASPVPRQSFFRFFYCFHSQKRNYEH